MMAVLSADRHRLGGTREELENACVVARNKVTRAKRNFRISAETCEVCLDLPAELVVSLKWF